MADASGSLPLRTPHELLAALRAQAAGTHVRVALDAMGGDLAPVETVKGALTVAGEHLSLVLVGRRDVLEPLVAGAQYVEIVDAEDVVSSSEEPAKAVRGRPDSSLVVAARLVADGQADALVSAGSTGAVLAASLLYVKRMQGVCRPAICQLMPSTPCPSSFWTWAPTLTCGPSICVSSPSWARRSPPRCWTFSGPRWGCCDRRGTGKGNQLVIEAHRLIAGDEQSASTATSRVVTS